MMQAIKKMKQLAPNDLLHFQFYTRSKTHLSIEEFIHVEHLLSAKSGVHVGACVGGPRGGGSGIWL